METMTSALPVAPGGSGENTDAKLGRVLVWSAGTLATVALIILLVFAPEGIRESPDPGAPLVPLWVVLLPAIAAVALTRALPWNAPTTAPVVSDRLAVRRSIIALLVCAIAFPVVVGVTEIGGSAWYFLAKIVILIGLPALLVWRSRHKIVIIRPREPWQWWPPIVIVAGWAWLSQASPWLPAQTFDWPDLTTIIIGATLTALTAGVGEELFYRYWLQTRLEGLVGRWGGIAVETLAYSLMHIGFDRQGNGLLVEIAAVIVVQGSFGFMLGYLWSRYRNLWLIITAHIIVNGYVPVAYLVSGQGAV